MSELQTTKATATTTSVPPQPASTDAKPATSGFSLDGFLGGTSTASAASGAPPEVMAVVGTTVVDGAKLSYLVLPDGTFRVTATPPQFAKAMGRELRPDNEFATSWKALCDQIVKSSQATQPQAPAAPTPSAPASDEVTEEGPGIGTVILDGVTAIAETLLAPLVAAGELFDAATDFVGDLFGSSEDEAGEDQVATPGDVPEEAPSGGATEAPAPVAPPGTTNNLDVAQKLANDTSMSHGYDGAVEGDVTTGARREAILTGDTDALKTILCGEFTTLTIAEAGYDLRQDYIHQAAEPTDQLPVAYKEKDGSITFVTLYAVSVNIDVALAAIVDIQNGGGTRITAKSDEAKAMKSSRNNKMSGKDSDGNPVVVWESQAPADRDTDFWLAGNTDVTKTEFKQGQVFGAGAVAAQLGGEVIANLTDRKPGDVQQRMDTNDAKTSGAGHSSTVYAVRGGGVARWGDGDLALVDKKGSPLPTDGLTSGAWYRTDGKTKFWQIGPSTDRAAVAELSATHIQLIDANRKTADDASGKDRGADATQVGAFSAATEFSDVGSSSLTVAGRLPSSPWAGWQPKEVPDAKDVP
ncbi:MAG: hypothetical protein HOV81_31370 [Kofleriaceae bacterium]|nr:hypothetical protein [Kofleriaceae bacterium]